MIWTRDLDDLSCTRCAPTIAARPSRKCIFNNKYKLSVYWVLKYRVGGRANNFVWLRVQSSVSGQDKGNESFLLLTKVIVARLRLPLDHLENAYLISINCRCIEFWNTGWGGGRITLSDWECNRAFPVRIKEMNHSFYWQKWSKRGTQN